MLRDLGGGLRRHSERGIVGLNLALTIAFALFAVIELSRVVLAAQQIGDRVKIITTEVGPGSNVSRLDETQKLNDVAQSAEAILAAAQPLSGQADVVLQTARSIDKTVTSINANATSINAAARSINGTFNALAPVVTQIRQGVVDINGRVDRVLSPVGGIKLDLDSIAADAKAIDGHTNGIDCAVAISGQACKR